MIADEPLPVHNVRLCRKPAAAERVRGAYQVPGAQKLPVRMEGGRAWVTVPCVRDYDLVVFDVE